MKQYICSIKQKKKCKVKKIFRYQILPINIRTGHKNILVIKFNFDTCLVRQIFYIPIENCPNFQISNQSATINVEINHILQFFNNNTKCTCQIFVCETFSFEIMVNAPFRKNSYDQNSQIKNNTMVNIGNNFRLMSKVFSRLFPSSLIVTR